MSSPRFCILLGAIFAVGVGFGLATRSAHQNSRDGEQTVILPAPRTAAPPQQPNLLPNQNSATFDFADRLEAILAMPNQYKRTRAIAAAADDLSPAEIRDALARLDKVHFHDRDKLLSSLLHRWGELEPHAALEYACKIGGEDGSSSVTHVVKGWCESDPPAVEEWIAQLPQGYRREAARSALIEALAVSDPRKAFVVARKAPGYALEPLFSMWADTNPEEAAAYALQLPTGCSRAAAIWATAAAWSRKDISAALAWAQSVTGKEADASYPTPPIAIVLHEWIDQAPDEAIRWIEQMPDVRERGSVIERLSSMLQENDTDMAVRLVELLPPGKTRERAVGQIASELSRSHFDRAIAWLNQQTDVRSRDAIIQELAWGLADRNPVEAMEIVQSMAGAGQRQATINVLKSWSQSNPAAAAKWAEVNGANTEQMSSLATWWARRDRQAATDWLASLPEGPAKDDVLRQSGNEFQRTCPELALAWTGAISDESTRLASYEEIAESWLWWDTRAAKAWLADSPLPGDFKKKLLEEYEK